MFSEMEQMGIIPSALHCNLTQDEWKVLELEKGEGRLSDNNTVIVDTGIYTGRSPALYIVILHRMNGRYWNLKEAKEDYLITTP